MSKIKLVITDVDGTLVTTEKALRRSSVAAVCTMPASALRSAAAGRPSA
jgi:phosphoglycolate phosphatase-like HAD superfamily hydrolase